MRRSLLLFLVILGAGTYFWPWLSEIGMMTVPGDMTTSIQGYRVHLPFGTAVLISAVISGVWWMLDPRS